MLNHSDLTAAQKEFIDRVCESLATNFDPGQVAVYGDGSASPHGEKYAATRQGAQWNLVFDFSIGACYHTAVYLPADWQLQFKLGK